MKRIIPCLILLITIFGCSTDDKAKQEQVQPIPENEIVEQEDNKQDEISSDPVDAVIDSNGTYYSDDDSIPCLIINDLRVRDNPNGNLIVYDDGNAHADVKCYRVSETQTDDKYTWVKSDYGNFWFGTTPEWIQNIVPNKDVARFDLEERARYSETGYYNAGTGEELNVSKWSSYSDINCLYPMDEDTYKMCLFLKKAIPGMCWMIRDVVDFDARNPSEEAKTRVYWQINYFGPVLKKEKSNIETILNGWGSSYITLKEHADYYTEKMYGNVINMQTATVYDSVNQVYSLLTFLNGHGSYLPFPIVLNQNREGDYITAQVALIEYEEADRWNGQLYLVDNDDFKDLRGIDTKSYIENEAKKCECVLKVTESGSYQLITVKLI